MNMRQRGFTLIELMVTLIVVGILVALAAPSFNVQILNNRSVAFSETFISELNSARYEAISRATNVTMCASSNGTTCSNVWTDGYIIFVDTAANSSAATPIIGTIIRASERLDSKTSLSIVTGGSSSAVSFIRFTSLGALGRVGNNNAGIDVHVQMVGCKGNYRRDIAIGLLGTISVVQAACQ